MIMLSLINHGDCSVSNLKYCVFSFFCAAYALKTWYKLILETQREQPVLLLKNVLHELITPMNSHMILFQKNKVDLGYRLCFCRLSLCSALLKVFSSTSQLANELIYVHQLKVAV